MFKWEISLLLVIVSFTVCVNATTCPQGWEKKTLTYNVGPGKTVTSLVCHEAPCGNCGHKSEDEKTACCCTSDRKVPGFENMEGDKWACNVSRNDIKFYKTFQVNDKGETVLGYACCPKAATIAPINSLYDNQGELCCPGEIYKVKVSDIENLCCAEPNKVEKCDDGTSKCGETCCPEGEEEYIPGNGKIDCCLENRVYTDDNGQKACCASDLKEVNGEQVCMGCKKDEIPYVNEDGKEDCCAGSLYNKKDQDGDPATTDDITHKCCPKCTKDTDGDGVFDAPDGCGMVKNK